MKKRNIVIIILLLCALAFAINKIFYADGKIQVTKPVRGQAIHVVYATGTVEPTVMMPISPRSSARLMELKVDEGSKVSKGQVLAQLEDDELQHTINELQAKEEWAQKEYERNVALQKNNVSSKQSYDQSKANLKAAIEAKNTAIAQAKYLQLLAPADGLIIKRDGEIGQLITSGTAVFWLSCCAPLRISAEVDEEDIAFVKAEQDVLIRADAFGGKIFKGKVQAITPKGDPISRSYRVRIEFSEETPLQIGMTAENNIMIDKKDNALLVPGSAVKNNKVWVDADGIAQQRDVKTGIKSQDKMEILDGLTENDLVIVQPQDNIKSGDKIRSVIIEQSKP